MNINSLVRFGVILAVVELVAPMRGQLATPNPTPTKAASAYSNDFQTIDKSKGNLVRLDPTVDWRRYRSFHIEPTTYQPSNPENGLSASHAEKMRAKFDNYLTSAFRNSATGVSPLLVVKPVITDVRRTNTLLNLIGFAAIQMPISYGGASVRYELVDAASGILLGEITSTRNSRPWNVYPWNVLQNFETTGQSSVILKSDAKRLRKDIARLANAFPSTTFPPSEGSN